MKDFTKTFKSEYHFGGTCSIQRLGDILLCWFGDHQITWRESIKNGGSIARISQFIEMNTSSYEGEKVINYLKKKVNEK